ncbi:MAG: OmpA family protein [Acidimicrobiia bacterium]|nr:OmpA family protein [Acidimicrobiia bacterium]
MTDNDELPEWTSRTPEGVQPVQQRRSRAALTALAALVALIGMGAIGYFIAQSQADSETATVDDPAAPTVDSEDATADITADSQDSDQAASDQEAVVVEGDDAEAMSVDLDDTEDEGSTDAGTTDGELDSGRTAVFRGGKLYLGGKVPSQEIADLIAQKAMSVVGPDNVVAEYEIDPSVTIDPGESTPLYVEDVVLFRFNSVEIDPPFYPLLDLGTLLLSQNPQASLTVVTRTDAVGSEEVNLEVAQRRADAVISYWIAQGVDREQLNADPRGEEGASEDDDEQTAALQRRAEFIITGLLD